MKKTTQFLAALFLLSATVSCVSGGRGFSLDDARRIELGMSEAEVTAIMGEPSSTSIDLTGEVWLWVCVDRRFNSKVFAAKIKDGSVIYIHR